jgi:hypothetical protein
MGTGGGGRKEGRKEGREEGKEDEVLKRSRSRHVVSG